MGYDVDAQNRDRDAIADGKCPECGQALEGQNVDAHRLNHWPDPTPTTQLGEGATFRRQLLVDYKPRQRGR